MRFFDGLLFLHYYRRDILFMHRVTKSVVLLVLGLCLLSQMVSFQSKLDKKGIALIKGHKNIVYL